MKEKVEAYYMYVYHVWFNFKFTKKNCCWNGDFYRRCHLSTTIKSEKLWTCVVGSVGAWTLFENMNLIFALVVSKSMWMMVAFLVVCDGLISLQLFVIGEQKLYSPFLWRGFNCSGQGSTA